MPFLNPTSRMRMRSPLSSFRKESPVSLPFDVSLILSVLYKETRLTRQTPRTTVLYDANQTNFQISNSITSEDDIAQRRKILEAVLTIPYLTEENTFKFKDSSSKKVVNKFYDMLAGITCWTSLSVTMLDKFPSKPSSPLYLHVMRLFVFQDSCSLSSQMCLLYFVTRGRFVLERQSIQRKLSVSTFVAYFILAFTTEFLRATSSRLVIQVKHAGARFRERCGEPSVVFQKLRRVCLLLSLSLSNEREHHRRLRSNVFDG